MSKATSKLTLMFVFDSVSYYANQSMTYYAKKGQNDARMTRISKSAFETAQGALAFQNECLAEIAAKSAQTESDPVTPVDPVPASIEAESVTVDPSPATAEVVDATTRPDWEAQQSFERITAEDLQKVPALVARGLGFAAMGLAKVAAMGIGALAGLGIMGLKKIIAR